MPRFKIAGDCDGRYVPHRCQYCEFWPICKKLAEGDIHR